MNSTADPPKAPDREARRGSPDGGTRYRGTAEERRALGAFVKLLRAAHWASERAGEYRARAGLTETQLGVLEALYHVGPMVQVELSEKLLSSPSNLTTVLENLERDDLVARRIRPSDRRCREVSLTDDGRRTIEAVLPGHVAGIVRIMDALSPSEQERLGELCRKLGRAAEALGEVDGWHPEPT